MARADQQKIRRGHPHGGIEPDQPVEFRCLWTSRVPCQASKRPPMLGMLMRCACSIAAASSASFNSTGRGRLPPSSKKSTRYVAIEKRLRGRPSRSSGPPTRSAMTCIKSAVPALIGERVYRIRIADRAGSTADLTFRLQSPTPPHAEDREPSDTDRAWGRYPKPPFTKKAGRVPRAFRGRPERVNWRNQHKVWGGHDGVAQI